MALHLPRMRNSSQRVPPTRQSSNPSSSFVLQEHHDFSSQILYTCSLPPTCNHKPARFHSPAELESHHRTHHAFTCASTDCQRIFPSQFFLDLHFNEVHNPLLLVQRENRHTKIFRCFEPICEKSFSSPKTRRLHLIDMHEYPRTFFFSLPNQGLNDLYKKFGPGVSLIRPDWKPSNGRSDAPSKFSISDDNASKIGVPNATTTAGHESESIAGRIEYTDRNKTHGDDNMEGIDSVIDSVQQLSLVPRQIQFGKKAGSKSFQR
ncbi:hypothetical protein VP01_3197g2 [Puccinia sorghi]|uniref:C2H2-type domain-containing protein n=1 Tax=Puccinia sorghi TaxID=27349 RepID=A0A0L6UYL1_9BASI|nr:hypothetical protein VP01_3197g2 [Puccinia sorghi]